ncbi:DAK2 domain-containing protein [Rhodococcus sp. NPDC003318]|uniref:DAK2 domain-containing protein n=1 Tax=Rhodococcus sp. NPDC003318 TaxID=3364503 RepID=UPI00369DABFF
MLEALQEVDGAALRRWARVCVDGLASRCDDINKLNVFPVPDSDTGTNLLHTMRAAAEGAYAVDDGASAGEVATALARGAVSGARGNSGVILSQVLRGIAEVARSGRLDARTVCSALNEAAVLATDAISIPVEGTIVTVLRHAAAAADACPDGTDLAGVVSAASDGAVEALAHTPAQLAELSRAGVVDAGGLGLVVILDSLVGVVTGVTPDRSDLSLVAGPTEVPPPAPLPARCADVSSSRDYEVMYLLSDSDEHRVGELRHRLGVLGDSVIIVGDGADSWSVHVHCADAGAAVEAGLSAGAVHRIRISCFALDATPARPGTSVPVPGRRCILAVVTGDGAAELFAAEGAEVLRADEPVTPERLLAAIRELGGTEVLVLPNGVLPAQELVTVGVAARDDHRSVLLLPTSSMVQGLAALAVHDDSLAAVDDGFAMSEAAASTRWGSVRVAAQRSLTLMGTCEAGDGLGLIGHEVVVIAADAEEAGRRLLDQVLGVGGELVTLLLGAAAPGGLANALTDHVARNHPGVEVLVYPGGQDGDLLQVGVE